MNWFIDLFTQGSVPQTILLLSIISISGLALGRIKVGGVQLGSSFVFFAAIAAGHFVHRYDIQVNADMIDLAKNFGLVLFVYTLGLQCGPGFFSSLRKNGIKLVLCAIATILLGSIATALVPLFTGLKSYEAVGLLSGAVTNTPSLISAQQTVLNIDPDAQGAANIVGAAYAVAYPFSVLTVILCIILLKTLFPQSVKKSAGRATDRFTAITEVHVCNSELFGKKVIDVVQASGFHFVISRLWRDGKVHIPVSDTILNEDDHLLIICDKEDIHKFGRIFGHEENKDWNRPNVDWNILDQKLVSVHLRVTRRQIVGISLNELKIRNKFGVNITRINRAGITLVPSADTTLQFGDRLTVVGDENKIKALAKVMGNEEQRLNEPRLIPLLLGIFLGVFLGCIPINIPGMSTPLKLGIAGGPIIMGILMGALGPKLHITTYTTRAANLMLRQLGITFFFAALGLGVGSNFVETVFTTQGLKWAAVSIALAALPILIMGIFNEKVLKMDFAKNVGMLCGTATNSNALAYCNTILENDNPAEAYATVYPFTIFLRVFLAQVLILIL